MKFVCDNCQAKYQIGDDKVAGRTVRMKCRRCGHDIRVRADGAAAGPHESSAPDMDAPMSLGPSSMGSGQWQAVPSAPSGAPIPPPPQGVPVPHGLPAPPPRAPAAPPRAPAPSSASLPPHGLPAPPPPRALATSSAALPRPVPAPPPPRAPTTSAPLGAPLGAPHGAPAPRPSAPARPVSTATPAPRPAPAAAPAPGVRPPLRPVTRTSSSTLSAVRPPEVAAVAAAALPAAAPAAEPPPAVGGGLEWYVGIAGTPTGPLRVSTIGERAAAGEVDGDSLVWREGISEWRPLKTFPDLLAVVTAAKAPPVAPTATFTPSPAPLAAAPLSAPPLSATPAAAVVQPSTPAPAPVSHVLADPFATPAGPTNGKSNGVHLQAVVPFGHDAPRADPAPPAPVGADAPASAPAPAAKHDPQADLDLVLGRKPASGTHPMAYAFIAAAAVFGGVAAYVLLSKPQVVVVSGPVVQVAATAASGSASAEPDKGQVEVGEVSTGTQPGSPAPRLGVRPKSTAGTVPVVGTAAPIDTSGFVNNVPGPAATAPGASQPGGGGQLSQGEIGAVVSQNQPMVKRKCWQPALEARPPNGATTARVNGSITISASGAVDSASASGAEKDFPGLSSCIQGRMKGWKFPPSGGSTTVNVPFVFAGQ